MFPTPVLRHGIPILAGVLVGAGLWLACVAGQPEPMTPAQAFQAVCTAAVLVETTQRQVEVPLGVQRLCSDPALPGRILALLGAVEPLVQVIEGAPLPDAGR